MIRHGIFPERMAGHVGYYAFLRPIMIVGTAVGLSASFIANVTAALVMAAAVALCYRLLRQLELERSVAVTGTLILGLSGLEGSLGRRGEGRYDEQARHHGDEPERRLGAAHHCGR